MNNSTQAPSLMIVAEHPHRDGECVRVALPLETEKRKAAGVNSKTRATPPKCARASGGTNRVTPPKGGAAATVSPAAGAAHADSAASSVVNWRGFFPAAFSLALLAAPAVADTCRYGPNSVATTVSIEPHETAFAVVQIENKLAFRTERYCDLTIFGVTVTVEYDTGAGSLPDWFRVTVPHGFVAVPPEILIDDHDSGKVLIVLERGLGA